MHKYRFYISVQKIIELKLGAINEFYCLVLAKLGIYTLIFVGSDQKGDTNQTIVFQTGSYSGYFIKIFLGPEVTREI